MIHHNQELTWPDIVRYQEKLIDVSYIKNNITYTLVEQMLRVYFYFHATAFYFEAPQLKCVLYKETTEQTVPM